MIVLTFDQLVSKPRMTRADKWKRRPAVLRYREFCDHVRERSPRPVPTAEEYQLTFEIEMPRSWSRRKRDEMRGTPHRSKPDLDNLIKAVFDALYPEDDSAVHTLTMCTKRWADESRVTVTLFNHEAGRSAPGGSSPARS